MTLVAAALAGSSGRFSGGLIFDRWQVDAIPGARPASRSNPALWRSFAVAGVRARRTLASRQSAPGILAEQQLQAHLGTGGSWRALAAQLTTALPPIRHFDHSDSLGRRRLAVRLRKRAHPKTCFPSPAGQVWACPSGPQWITAFPRPLLSGDHQALELPRTLVRPAQFLSRAWLAVPGSVLALAECLRSCGRWRIEPSDAS